MKRNNSIILLLTILFVCSIYSSCVNNRQKNGTIQIIKIDLGNRKIEKAITIKEVIPLETSNDCLIGYTTKVIFWNNRIIVLDNYRSKSMFVFDEKGKLVFKSAIGKGPGEVSSADAININKKDSTILLYDHVKNIFHKYDFSGNYIGRMSIPRSIFIRDFFPIANDSLLVYYSSPLINSKGEKRQTTYSMYTDDYSNAKHLSIYVSPNKISHSLGSPVAMFSDEILFVAPWSYDIYQLEGDNFRIKYSLDFGNAALTPWQIESLSTYELIPLVHQSNMNKVGCLKSVFFNDSDLIICAEHGESGLNILYSFKDERTCNLNNYFEKGLLPVCCVWGIKDNGCIYALVKPSDFEKFNKLSSGRFSRLGITSNDNPILISFQIESSL